MTRIAFVGNYQYNCGSSNTLLGYARAGKTLGYDVRVSEFGFVDKAIRARVPIADRNWQPDLFVIVYESYQFLSNTDIDQICTIISRSKRIIIDPDGKYSRPINASGDTNHASETSYKFWTRLYDSLSDTILQPYVGSRDRGKIKPFIYFGIDKNFINPDKPKDYDMIYVGNNWYKWHDLQKLVEFIVPIRTRLKKIALVGNYWLGQLMPGYEDAIYSEPDFLRKNDIKVLKSAPYGKVEYTMSKGLLNPILVRPILNHMGFITPRMFETFNADTVPLIPSYFTHSAELYGNYSSKLKIPDNPEDINTILDSYDEYLEITKEIRRMLKAKHSYEVRLRELVNFIK